MRFSLFVLLALTAASAVAQPVAGTRLDGIAAVIGDQVVLYSEVDALVQQASTGQRELPPDVWSRALDQLIDNRVMIDNARRDTTLNVTDQMVSEEVERNVQQLVTQAGSQAELEAAFGRPLSQIRESFREEVRDEILLQQYRGRRLRDITVTPGEVRAFYNALPVEARTETVPELVRVAHVVKKPAPGAESKAAARTFAQALRDSVEAEQATLAELANRHSSDPGNTNRDGTQNGGSYRSFALRDLDPTFAAAAAALDNGGLSQVFETRFGFHVLRLDERVGERVSFSHILIPVSQTGLETDVARRELETLRDSVATGRVPFEAIARRHSEDPYSASRGGFVSDPRTGERDLSIAALGTAWRATVDTMSVGDISGVAPVQLLDQTDVLHFVLLQRRTPEHELSLDVDYALISESASNDKRQRVLREWIVSLKRRTFVDIRAEQYTPPTQTASAQP